MQKMLIKLNDEKIIKAGLDPIGFKAYVDGVFEKTGGHIIKEVLTDGSLYFVGNPLYENYLCYFGIAYSKFKYNKDFLKVADKWLWISDENNNGDENVMNVLERIKIGK